MSEPVKVNNGGTERRKDPCDRGFPSPDPTGKTDDRRFGFRVGSRQFVCAVVSYNSRPRDQSTTPIGC